MRSFTGDARKTGFTLVEVLAGFLVIAIMVASLSFFLRASIAFFFRISDARVALERCERAVALLTVPLMNCGYGLPRDADGFREAFGSRSYKPFNWPGPFSVANDSGRDAPGVHRNAVARIVYSVPSGARSVFSTASSGEGEFVVYLNKNTSLGESGYEPLKPQNWAVFGAMSPDSAPLHITSVKDRRFIMRSAANPGRSADLPVIHRNDEFCSLHAIEVSIKKFDGVPSLAVNDFRGSGTQPRVRGVVDARFEYDGPSGLLVLRLLARGERRYAEIVSMGDVEGWPSEYGISDEDRHYTLRASTSSWRLPNLGRR